jgi:hypothetical protein
MYHGTCVHLNDMPINPSYQWVCLYVYLPIIARQRLGKIVTAAMNTRTPIEELYSSFYVRSVPYQRKVF